VRRAPRFEGEARDARPGARPLLGCLALGAFALAQAAAPATAAEPTVDVQGMLRGDVLAPATREAAVRAGFPIAGIPLQAAASGLDGSAVALVSLTSLDGRGAPMQWVVRMALSGSARGPGAPSPRDVTRYTNVGDTFVYHSADTAAMDLDILAPTEVPAAIHNRASVSPDFLVLDLLRAAEVVRRLHEVAATIPGVPYGFDSRLEPYSEAEVAAGRHRLAKFKLSVGERRSFTGSILALAEFFQVIQATPGLDRILLEVIEKPGIMDVVRHAGQPGLGFMAIYANKVDTGDLFWRDGEPRVPTDLFAINVIAFGRPVLTIALVVAAPVPPLGVTAGVLGAVAWGPDHPDRVIAVRLLAARPGP
jgi:hypothetical protein